MGRRKKDSIDQACEEWAKAKRRMLGFDAEPLASGVIGPLRSTLGQRRDLHAGSRSSKVDQHWPEVYQNDEALQVARAYARMRDDLRDVMVAHYVYRGPIDDKAASMAVCRAKYFQMVNQAKRFVEGWLANS